jgi:hypothetical protein
LGLVDPGPQHHGCARLLTPQDPGGLDAVHSGHAQVHKHHVGVIRGGLGQGLGTILGLADHRQPGPL